MTGPRAVNELGGTVIPGSLSGGRYMAARKCKLVLYMFTPLLGSHWLHRSIYFVLIV